MTERLTPFGLVFTDLARERFPSLAESLERAGAPSDNRDAFVLLEPVARLLQDVAPPEASPDEIEAHLRLLHHAYRHWSAGGFVYRIGDDTLARAVEASQISARLPRPALYIQLPTGKVWRPASGDTPAEPLDGAFVTATSTPNTVAVLGIFGMHRARPGFSAVAVDGRVDEDDPGPSELAVAASRSDGSPLFTLALPGGARAGLHSVTTPAELLLLVCRLIALLPAGEAAREPPETPEVIIAV